MCQINQQNKQNLWWHHKKKLLQTIAKPIARCNEIWRKLSFWKNSVLIQCIINITWTSLMQIYHLVDEKWINSHTSKDALDITMEHYGHKNWYFNSDWSYPSASNDSFIIQCIINITWTSFDANISFGLWEMNQ